MHLQNSVNLHFHVTDDPTIIYGNSGKLCHTCLALTIQQPYLAIQENFIITHFPWHWRSNTIYGDSGKLHHTFSMALTIQRPYMVIQENFCHTFSMTLTIRRPYMVNFGYYRELSSHTRTCKAWCSFLLLILVKWRSNKTLASVGLAQARPNKPHSYWANYIPQQLSTQSQASLPM